MNPVPSAARAQPTHRPASESITNALTIDVEDYFQVSAFADSIARSQWDSLECRVERNVHRMLDLLAQKNARATFFTLGWIAERYPALVRRIVADGHELASHGHGHQRASDLSPAEFTEDVRKAKAILEDIGGVRIRGYRAPSFSIGQGNLWALDVLQATGHDYRPASTPSNTTTTARPTRRASPTPSAKAWSKSHPPPCACWTATCPRAAAAISACCPTASRAG